MPSVAHLPSGKLVRHWPILSSYKGQKQNVNSNFLILFYKMTSFLTLQIQRTRTESAINKKRLATLTVAKNVNTPEVISLFSV